MKKDLATSFFVAIVCVLVSYFVCNMFLQEPASVTFPVLSSSVNYTINNPDPEIFNYRAINPTVEVYVGQCIEYNQYGECVKDYIPEDVRDEDSDDAEDTEGDSADQTEDSDNQDQAEDADNGTTD